MRRTGKAARLRAGPWMCGQCARKTRRLSRGRRREGWDACVARVRARGRTLVRGWARNSRAARGETCRRTGKPRGRTLVRGLARNACATCGGACFARLAGEGHPGPNASRARSRRVPAPVPTRCASLLATIRPGWACSTAVSAGDSSINGAFAWKRAKWTG